MIPSERDDHQELRNFNTGLLLIYFKIHIAQVNIFIKEQYKDYNVIIALQTFCQTNTPSTNVIKSVSMYFFGTVFI